MEQYTVLYSLLRKICQLNYASQSQRGCSEKKFILKMNKIQFINNICVYLLNHCIFEIEPLANKGNPNFKKRQIRVLSRLIYVHINFIALLFKDEKNLTPGVIKLSLESCFFKNVLTSNFTRKSTRNISKEEIWNNVVIEK